MAEYCGQCAHLDTKNKERYTSKDRYYCNKRWKYVELTEIACYNFVLDPQKCKTNNGSYNPSGCFITTIVCDVLGYEDNCEVLKTLRGFRDTTLKADPKYLSLLLEYDFVGPLISIGIQNEINNKTFCLGLLKHFLIPCVNEIKNENIENAINIYKNMVLYLNDEFNLPSITIDMKEPYDLETLGKGRVRK